MRAEKAVPVPARNLLPMATFAAMTLVRWPGWDDSRQIQDQQGGDGHAKRVLLTRLLALPAEP